MTKVMEFFKKPFFRRYANYLVIAFVVLLFTVFSLSGSKELAKPSTLYLLEKIGVAMVLALSLSMVVGFLGELSLGHAGFMCAG
ncbi:MAG: branched-chain amino acid ABC transporter permease, partial [Clostridia bacterium]|nr:branched-chain amino acid ABC transporter permease [Clostridia bacterium]